MSQPDMSTSGSAPPPERRSTPWILAAVGGIAALVLIIGFVVWVGSRDDEITIDSTPSTTEDAATTLPTTTGPTTTTTIAPTTTAATTTTIAATTVPATTVPAATTTLPTGPSGVSWTITSQYYPDDPFTLVRVAQVESVSAYDGSIDVTPDGIRCVAVVIDGNDGWHEWCGEGGQATRFLLLDGIDPWLVEVGAVPEDVTLTRHEPTWTLPTNGCTSAVTTLLAAAPTDPAVTTAIVCAPGEAFMSIGSVLLQPGPPDGGGALLVEGDEGWDTLDFGTSIGCGGWPDGVDRCALFNVEFELFEALLPIPPDNMLTLATDLIGLRDETATVAGWIGAETDPAGIDAIIVDQLTDPEAEVPPNISRANGVGFGGAMNLLIVEVPAMDDSILSTTWAVWISAGSPASVVQVFAWETCARGLAAPDLCI